jgi:hypothetical protein
MKIDSGRRTMEKIQRTKRLLFFLFLLAGLSVLAVPASGEEQGGNEQRAAGQEVTKAPGSGGDTTKETAGISWDKTKAESKALMHTISKKTKNVWAKTKAESKEAWEKGKAKMHEVTAPTPPSAPAKPVTPPPTPPVVESAKPATPVPVQL